MTWHVSVGLGANVKLYKLVKPVPSLLRENTLPHVPAVSETLPGYQFPMWVGLFAPAKTPKPIIDRLAAEVTKAMQDPLTRKRYSELSVEPRGSTPQEFDTSF